MSMHLFLLCLLLLSGIAAVMASNMLLSAMFLALSSVALTLIMFAMHSPWAAAFELSVCAGLITVLFVSTVSLVRKSEAFLTEDRVRFYALPFFLALFGLAFWLFGEPLSQALVPGLPTGSEISVGDTLWRVRWFDVIGQLAIFLAAVLTVNAFFKKRGNGNA